MFRVIGQQPSADTIRDIVKDMKTTQDVVIHWGVAQRQYPDNVFTLNNTTYKNALQQFEAFKNAGLTIPIITNNVEEAKEWVRQGILMWGRRVEHTRGNDIIGPGYKRINHKEAFNRNWLGRDFWVRVIKPELIKDEWRVHIFQGRCIAKGRKVQTGEATRRWGFIRSRNNGWTLEHATELPDMVREAARKAVAALGYNFGAVDILEVGEGNPVILEVNSAPALGSDYTINAYQQALTKIAEGKYRKIYEGKQDA